MTNAQSSAGDRYAVCRPVLDLIGLSEGTDKARGYNETLAYGAYTGVPARLFAAGWRARAAMTVCSVVSSAWRCGIATTAGACAYQK